MTPSALPYISLLAILFGTTLVVSRFSVGQFSPFTYLGLRYGIASLCYMAIFTVSSKRHVPRARQIWGHAAVLGVFGTAVPTTLIVTSLLYQSSGVTSLLLTAGPALTVLMAHFLLHDEPLTRRKILGVGLAISGSALLIILGENGLPEVSQANPLGYGMVLLAVIMGSYMTIYARKYMKDLDWFDVGSVRMWTAAMVMIPFSLIFAGFDLSQVTPQGYVALLYAAVVGTFGSMMLAFYNIKRFGATAAAMVSILVPIVAIFTGALLLGEVISTGMLLAMALIISGIAILNIGRRSVRGVSRAGSGRESGEY